MCYLASLIQAKLFEEKSQVTFTHTSQILADVERPATPQAAVSAHTFILVQ